MFNIFKKERKRQGFLDVKLHEVPRETIEEKNKEKNGIFDEYYEWESAYCGDDFPNFDDYLEYKDWIEGIEKEKDSDNSEEIDSYTEGDILSSGKDKQLSSD